DATFVLLGDTLATHANGSVDLNSVRHQLHVVPHPVRSPCELRLLANLRQLGLEVGVLEVVDDFKSQVQSERRLRDHTTPTIVTIGGSLNLDVLVHCSFGTILR